MVSYLSLVVILFVSVFASDVSTITDSNYDLLINDGKNGTWFVYFHVPWCLICDQFSSVWKNLANETSSSLSFGEVDAMAERELSSRFYINHYPTLLVIRDGKVCEYADVRSIEKLRRAIKTDFQEMEFATLPEKPAVLPIMIQETILRWNNWLLLHPILASLLISGSGFLMGVSLTEMIFVICKKRD